MTKNTVVTPSLLQHVMLDIIVFIYVHGWDERTLPNKNDNILNKKKYIYIYNLNHLLYIPTYHNISHIYIYIYIYINTYEAVRIYIVRARG